MPIPLKIPIDAFCILFNIHWSELTIKQTEEIIKGFSLSEKLRLKILNNEDKIKISSYLSANEVHLGSHPSLCIALTMNDTNFESLFINDYNSSKVGLLAFRLLKSGDIFMESIGVPHDRDQLPISFPPIIYWDGIYKFSYDEITEVIKIYQMLQKVDFKKHNSMKIACDRFNRSYYDFEPEDKLIDIMIGFETLFIQVGDRKPNKGHKIGKKCSEEIMDNSAEKKWIYKHIKRAWNLRNDVLHSSPYDIKEINNLLPSIEDYLRRSILKKLL